MPDANDTFASSPDGDAALAAALFAVDSVGIGGVVLRARVGPARDVWLNLMRELLPAGSPIVRLPGNISDDRLLGGLDLAATLALGRRVPERGVLAGADGGVLIVPLAERCRATLAARIACAIDQGGVNVERDGLTHTTPTRFGVVALDEGIDDERAPAALHERLGIHLDLNQISADVDPTIVSRADVDSARERLDRVSIEPGIVQSLCCAAQALGVGSMHAAYLALRVARAAAALADEDAVTADHAALAARLVLAPRATLIPAAEAAESEPAPSPESRTEESEDDTSAQPLEDIVVAAAKAAIPANLLANLAAPTRRSPRAANGGRAGDRRTPSRRGAPAGTRPGTPERGARLNLVETLRAAVPWQKLRGSPSRAGTRRMEVRRDDLRVWRCIESNETVTIFVVDASGSSALHRLAEAKGAVELLLADCYVRRDQVAVLAFGGRGAELLLPPTRSLARAKRRLAELPGGGGTPLASALEKATALAALVRRKHQTPAIVVLTDGKPNLARDGRRGRQAGKEDALAAAAALRAIGVAGLVIDTSVRADPLAAQIAEAMGARYVPLPHANARTVSDIVRSGFGGSGS